MIEYNACEGTTRRHLFLWKILWDEKKQKTNYERPWVVLWSDMGVGSSGHDILRNGDLRCIGQYVSGNGGWHTSKYAYFAHVCSPVKRAWVTYLTVHEWVSEVLSQKTPLRIDTDLYPHNLTQESFTNIKCLSTFVQVQNKSVGPWV